MVFRFVACACVAFYILIAEADSNVSCGAVVLGVYCTCVELSRTSDPTGLNVIPSLLVTHSGWPML